MPSFFAAVDTDVPFSVRRSISLRVARISSTLGRGCGTVTPTAPFASHRGGQLAARAGPRPGDVRTVGRAVERRRDGRWKCAPAFLSPSPGHHLPTSSPGPGVAAQPATPMVLYVVRYGVTILSAQAPDVPGDRRSLTTLRARPRHTALAFCRGGDGVPRARRAAFKLREPAPRPNPRRARAAGGIPSAGAAGRWPSRRAKRPPAAEQRDELALVGRSRRRSRPRRHPGATRSPGSGCRTGPTRSTGPA